MTAQAVPPARLAPDRRRRRWRRALLGALCGAFVAQCLYTASASSLANDEAKHLFTGWWLLQTGNCCQGIDNSPLTAWFALPLLAFAVEVPQPLATADAHQLGRMLLFGADAGASAVGVADPERVLLLARLMNIAAGVGLLVVAARLADRLFGRGAGLLPAAVLAFEPNVVAHFSLVSTDALLLVAAVLYVYACDRLLLRPTAARAALAGLALGLALVTKLSAMVLVAATPPLLLLYRTALQRHAAGLWCRRGLLAALAAGTVLWIGYGAHVAATPPFLAVPGLREGLAQVSGLARHGFPAFFMGETGAHWSWYFPVCLALKTPLAELVLWALSAVALAGRLRAGLLDRQLLPGLFASVFLAAGVASNLNIGVRHVLGVHAFAAIAAGALVPLVLRPAGRWQWRGAAVLALCALLAAEAVAIAPHGIAYFNALAGGPRGGVRYLGDSNLHWGQDLKALRDVLRERGIDEVILAYAGNTPPEFYGIRYQPLPPAVVPPRHPDHVVAERREVLAVSTNHLQGIVTAATDFAWLARRAPFATAGFGIYLYDITGDAVAHAELARLYTAHGFPALARAQADKAARYGRAPG